MNRTVEQYRSNVSELIATALHFESLDLDAMLETVERADAIGPILDPTAWRAGVDNLSPQRDILRAAIAFRNVVRRQRQDAIDALKRGADSEPTRSKP